MDNTAKLAESSEKTVQRNSSRDTNPKHLVFPNFHIRQFKSTAQMRELLQLQIESIMPDL
jgi:hypothetical protein